jgi:hypothetical protein
VERGVEHGNLRQVGQDGTHSLDAGKIRRVVERRQVTKRAQRGNNRVVHPDRRSEPLSAVHHPMTGPEQVSVGRPGLGQVIHHSGHDSLVSAFGNQFFDCGGRKPLDSQQRFRRAQPLTDPVHDTLATPGRQQRKLDR